MPLVKPQFELSALDAVQWLRDLPTASVDLVVTDPAYESLEKHRAVGTTTRLKHSKSSSNDWFRVFPNARFGELFAEVFRVLKPDTHFYLFCDAETMFVAKPEAEKAGFKFDYVAFNKQGELITALLSGSLDAIMSNPGEVLGLIQSGDMRALAYSGKSSPKALGAVPTFAKEGYDIGVSLPRGLVLPPGVPKEAQQWWIATMKKVVQTPEWKEYIEKNVLTENVLYAEDFRAFLKRTQGTFGDILRKQGAIKK